MLREEDGAVDVEVSVNGQALVFVSTCCTVVMTTRSKEGAREVRISLRPPGGDEESQFILCAFYFSFYITLHVKL